MSHLGSRGPTIRMTKEMIAAGSVVVRRLRCTDTSPSKIAEDVYRAMQQICITQPENRAVTPPENT